MAGDFSELDQWVKGLERLEKGLQGGREIFVANENRYLDLARNVGGQTLIAIRPENVDPEEWFEEVREFENLVFSRMTGNGMEIIYQGRTEEDGKRGTIPLITYDDVLEWVNAGPENGGKDITAIEGNRGRAPEQIAYDVHTAVRQHRLGFAGEKDYGPITERLEKFIESRVLSGNLGEMLGAVLSAWFTVLVPLMERDLADWVDDLIAEF